LSDPIGVLVGLLLYRLHDFGEALLTVRLDYHSVCVEGP
jgi:hypothetical protein